MFQEEAREQGSVGIATYSAYIRAAGGFGVAALLFAMFVLCVLSKMFSDFWLSYWVRQGDGKVRVLKNIHTTAIARSLIMLMLL